ncbi:MAG: hypothetical protein ACTTGJ_02945 [Clostridium sp.]
MLTNEGLKYYASDPDDESPCYEQLIKEGFDRFKEDMDAMYGENHMNSHIEHSSDRPID